MKITSNHYQNVPSGGDTRIAPRHIDNMEASSSGSASTEQTGGSSVGVLVFGVVFLWVVLNG